MVRNVARVRCSDGEIALSKDDSSRSSLLKTMHEDMECDDVVVPFSKAIVEQVFQGATDVLRVAQARLYFDVATKSYHDVVLALRELPMPIVVAPLLEMSLPCDHTFAFCHHYHLIRDTMRKDVTATALDVLTMVDDDAVLLAADAFVQDSHYNLPPHATAWFLDRVRRWGKCIAFRGPIHVNDLFVSLFALDPGFLLHPSRTDHISVLIKLEKRGVLMDERALARAVQNRLPDRVICWIAKRCVARPWIDAVLCEEALTAVRARRDVYLARAHLSVDLAGEVEKWIRETY